MVQTSELTRLSLPSLVPSTLKKKLRLSGDFFFRDLNIYISTLFYFSPCWRGFYFVFKTLSLYITIMERKFIVSFHKGVVLNSI